MTPTPISQKLSFAIGGYVMTIVFGFGWFAVMLAWKYGG